MALLATGRADGSFETAMTVFTRNPTEGGGWSDGYFTLLCIVLVGYAVLGKGFAYFGVPPIFVGEVALIAGATVLLASGCLVATLASFCSLLLAVTMLWTMIRTLPYVSSYGMDAFRDSVIVMYGGFAFVVVGLLLENERRLNAVVRYYNSFLSVYVPVIPLLFIASRYFRESIPNVPGTSVPLLMLGPGEVPVHLAGAVVFAMVGFRRATVLWVTPLVIAVVVASMTTRGGMLAFVVPVLLAALVLGKIRQVLSVVITGLAILAATYTVEGALTDERGLAAHEIDRQVSTKQILKNVESISGHSDSNLESTRTWRLEWWGKIVDNTIYGPNFWTGRGYGPNIALIDGYVDINDEAPLRSPHNAHMTILARSGVPGLTLWLGFCTAWLAMMVSAMVTAHLRGDRNWSAFFLFVVCYATSSIINATFDVALEGPMQGIWFWCLIGLGMGSAMIYRHRLSIGIVDQNRVIV
jgi:hypothetical protein